MELSYPIQKQLLIDKIYYKRYSYDAVEQKLH